MLCQDCHTSIDMHGDGNLPGTTLAQVEIECEDCHGTVAQLPWDLPLGYGEEHGMDACGHARGVWPPTAEPSCSRPSIRLRTAIC